LGLEPIPHSVYCVHIHLCFYPIVGPQGIEPCPLVLQTSVRTSYTKTPCLF
jgi:hypothetical protein